MAINRTFMGVNIFKPGGSPSLMGKITIFTMQWGMAEPTFSVEIPSPGLDHQAARAITNMYTAFDSFGIPAGRVLITHQLGQPGHTPSYLHHYDK